MTKTLLNHRAFYYRFKNTGLRAIRVWKDAGLRVFVKKSFEKIFRSIVYTQHEETETQFEVEVILNNPSFDLSKIDVISNIQLNPTVSIVVPVFNGISYVPGCIQSFFHAPVSVGFEVIIIDNGSTDGTLDTLRGLTQQHTNLVLIENSTNVGFAQAINQGVAAASGEFIAACNSDILATPGWLDRLRIAMQDDPQLAVVSPVTNYVGEGPQLDPDARHITPETANQYAQQVASRKEIIHIPDRLVFFCVLLRKQYFDFLGGLVGVFGLGNYEDDDFCLRARMAGYTLAVVPGAFVFHYGSRTFREQEIDHVDWMLKNEKVYLERVAEISTHIPPRTLPTPLFRSTPLVSVIVRTKDRPFPLRRALFSLANQTFQDLEVVIVNDGGKDVSTLLNEFNSYLKFNYITNSTPSGRATALNIGLDAARGKWITYLDDDDILYPLHLDLLVNEVTQHKTHVIAFTNVTKVLYWSDNLQKDLIIVERMHFTNVQFSLEQLLVDNLIPIMSFMHPADIVADVGKYDENIDIFEDWDLLIRLAQNYPFHHIARPTCEYRFRFGSRLDDSTLLMRERAMKFRKIIYKRYPVDNDEIEHKRTMTIHATQQQLEDIHRIASLQLDEIKRSFLISARLGGFSLPEAFR